MPISKKVLKHLDQNKVKYEIVAHKPVYTVFDLAQTLKKKMNEIAKTLLVKADKKYVLIVLPAHYRLDFVKLKKFLKAKQVALAPEKAMEKILKVKLGALTPFGALHKLEVVMDKALAKTSEVLMRAGSFTEALRLKVRDYINLEKPAQGDISKKK